MACGDYLNLSGGMYMVLMDDDISWVDGVDADLLDDYTVWLPFIYGLDSEPY